MHYFDEAHIDSNFLELVIYTHEIYEDGKRPALPLIDYEIASIQGCQYIRPSLLIHILTNVNDWIRDHDYGLENEEWYLFKIKEVEPENWLPGEFIVYDVTNVTNSENDFLRLH